MKYTISAECCYEGETADTPQSTGLDKEQVIMWLRKLLDTEPDMKSADINLIIE